MTEIIKVKDNIITEHSFVNRELRDGEIEVKDFNGNVGDNVNLYDENWNIIPVVETKAKSIAVDEDEDEDGITKYIPPVGATEPVQYTRTDELMSQLYEIDLASVRAIRAILSGTDTEEDYKTLKALEQQAKLLREELNVCQEK